MAGSTTCTCPRRTRIETALWVAPKLLSNRLWSTSDGPSNGCRACLCLWAGCPPEAFSFYPTDHEGSGAVLESCGRALVFGDVSTVERYAGNPGVEVHGPGWSKIVIGEDVIERWPEFVDLMVASIAENGGRSCVNASAILVPRRADEIAA